MRYSVDDIVTAVTIHGLELSPRKIIYYFYYTKLSFFPDSQSKIYIAIVHLHKTPLFILKLIHAELNPRKESKYNTIGNDTVLKTPVIIALNNNRKWILNKLGYTHLSKSEQFTLDNSDTEWLKVLIDA